MKLVVQKIWLCCLLAKLVPCAISAPLQMTSEQKVHPEPCVPKQGGMDSAELLPQSNDTEVLAAGHSAQMSERVKRGCNLLTCMVHDLAYRINQTSKRMNSAPQEKISPQGYGRRRRRSLLHQSAPRSRGEARLGLAWLHTQRRSAPQTQT